MGKLDRRGKKPFGELGDGCSPKRKRRSSYWKQFGKEHCSLCQMLVQILQRANSLRHPLLGVWDSSGWKGFSCVLLGRLSIFMEISL